MPDKPFFMYFAPGATHASHHVPEEWIERYKGKFSHGWDEQRERTFARQKELGVIPDDAELTARHDEIPAWDEMAEELKPILEREMEIYAGFMSHTDHHSQAHDLSRENPDRLHELQRLWLIEATKYNVIPLDDRTAERLSPDLSGRPQLITGDTQVFYPGMTSLSENSVLSIKNKSFSVTAEVVIPDDGANGTIIAQGGVIGGWSFYTKQGTAKFAYNLLGIQTFTAEAAEPVPPGQHQVRAEFAYDGGGYAKGGTVSLYYDGEKVGEGRVDATQPFVFSADEGLDVGCETGTAVAPECDAKSSAFTATAGFSRWLRCSPV